MEPDECDEVRISVPGDVLEGVDYTVTLRTNRGLYFDSSCSGASNQSREWAPQRTLSVRKSVRGMGLRGAYGGELVCGDAPGRRP